MNIITTASNLYLIPLDMNIKGFVSFISAWLYKGDRTFLIDVGPTATVPTLMSALNALEVRHLDAILLTHIHLDHAGGTGDIIKNFPDTPVVCHKSAISHLADPSRLWEGSLKTLGDIARAYEPLKPVPKNLLYDAALFDQYQIDAFLTPGHAPHHVSYRIGKYLFGGETGGVFVNLPGNGFYLRPATPPRFFLETSINSIDKLLDVKHDLLCYGHFGATTKTPQILKDHKQQLYTWESVIRKEIEKGKESDIMERCISTLLEKDPLLAGFSMMSPEVRERELFFFKNSLRGFIGYLNPNS